MSTLFWAVITKYHRLNGLDSRHLFSHSSGEWKCKIRVPAWLGPGEDFLSGLWSATFSVSSLDLSLVHAFRVISLFLFFFYEGHQSPHKDSIPNLTLITSQRPLLQISKAPSSNLKGPFFKYMVISYSSHSKLKCFTMVGCLVNFFYY